MSVWSLGLRVIKEVAINHIKGESERLKKKTVKQEERWVIFKFCTNEKIHVEFLNNFFFY